MHGAAQTANAAPSSAREPLAARPRQRAGREHPLRPGQQAHEREPEHDEHEAGDLRPRLAGRRQPPSAAAAAPSDDEDDREAERRTARSPRPRAARSRARRAGRPRPPRPRTGSRGRAAARRGRRSRRGRRRTPTAIRSAIEAGELLVEPALVAPARAACPFSDQRCGAGSGSRSRVQRHASTPSTAAPAEDADERQQPREQVEPVPRRRGEDPRARTASTSSSLIWLRVAPCRDAQRDVRLDPLRGRRVGLRQRLALADRAHQLALELGERRVLLARRRRRGQHQRHAARATSEPHDFSARATPSRMSAALHLARHVDDDLAASGR